MLYCHLILVKIGTYANITLVEYGFLILKGDMRYKY